jgi:hypothetical protein
VPISFQYYEVRGFPIYANHSYFDPRRHGYTLFAGTFGTTDGAPKKAATRGTAAKRKRRRGNAGRELWREYIPISGKAIAMAGDTLFVAGEPMEFEDPNVENYVAAYDGQLGGRLLAVSTRDGRQLGEYHLPAAPVWDSIAIASQQLFISLENGTVQCLGP